MSREVRRVPLDFDHPLKKVWTGYIRPDELDLPPCPDCRYGKDYPTGYSPRANYLNDLWYGKVRFNPKSMGSEWLQNYTPSVRAFAERNVERAPEYYGTGEIAIAHEARRLANLWNGMWSHHLSQEDVDVLAADGRLHDFTHNWVKGEGWKLKDPSYAPTAAEVNEWSLRGMGHDSINRWVVVRARCERESVPDTCATCNGECHIGTPEQVAANEAWEPTEPPEGEGWQIWETTSEGSPISPVFTDRDQVITFLMSDQYFGFGTKPTPLTRDQAEAFVGAGGSLGSFVEVGGQLIAGDKAVHAAQEANK